MESDRPETPQPGSLRPLQRIFTLKTGGSDDELDRLGICVDLFDEMGPSQRDRVMVYLNHRFRGV